MWLKTCLVWLLRLYNTQSPTSILLTNTLLYMRVIIMINRSIRIDMYSLGL